LLQKHVICTPNAIKKKKKFIFFIKKSKFADEFKGTFILDSFNVRRLKKIKIPLIFSDKRDFVTVSLANCWESGFFLELLKK
jgi:hypothetical protein